MHDRSRTAGQFRGKNVFARGSGSMGKAMLWAECSRVRMVPDLAEIAGEQLQLANASAVVIHESRGTGCAHTR